MAETTRESMYKLWKKAVTKTFDWVDEAPQVEEPEREVVGAAN
jgi:hypothetical protein